MFSNLILLSPLQCKNPSRFLIRKKSKKKTKKLWIKWHKKFDKICKIVWHRLWGSLDSASSRFRFLTTNIDKKYSKEIFQPLNMQFTSPLFESAPHATVSSTIQRKKNDFLTKAKNCNLMTLRTKFLFYL